MTSTALVTTTNAEAYRASTDAAGLSREIVLSTAMEIQKRRYVKVEGWQAIAIAHGCTASARGVERVEGGVRAIGEVRRMSDGHVIAEGEGFVGEDEATWFGGTVEGWEWGQKRGEKVKVMKTLPKRPDYAIRAMAQTRAISRACRSAFAHVVVMIDADLSTTPAEEVPMGGFDDRNVVDAEFTPVKETPKPKAEEKAEAPRQKTPQEAADIFIRALNGAENEADLQHHWGKGAGLCAVLSTADPEKLEEVTAVYDRRRAALSEANPFLEEAA